jgi:hypothetical protein
VNLLREIGIYTRKLTSKVGLSEPPVKNKSTKSNNEKIPGCENDYNAVVEREQVPDSSELNELDKIIDCVIIWAMNEQTTEPASKTDHLEQEQEAETEAVADTVVEPVAEPEAEPVLESEPIKQTFNNKVKRTYIKKKTQASADSNINSDNATAATLQTEAAEETSSVENSETAAQNQK